MATRNKGMPLEALRYDITPAGLHYLLVHFDIPAIEPAEWRLRVEGNVARPLELTFDDVRALPQRTLIVTLECAGNGRARLSPRPVSQPWLNEAVGTAEWCGTPLTSVLDAAGLKPATVELVFCGGDHGVEKGYEHDYARSLTLDAARDPDVLLAYEMNGRPIEPQHGAPLRLIVPGWYGMTHVKWLRQIDAITEPFDGYQQRVAYRYRQDASDPGEPVSLIKPRALMAPPGFPDFLTRRRTVDQGRVRVAGRAWSGSGEIVRVELGVDGRWQDAELGPAPGRYVWRGWTCAWDATPGEHVLTCRATDGQGNQQPVEPHWNLQGMGNNVVQSVSVTVR